ncbi:MAG: alpha/beta hydrolase [Chloroflexota bacterium]
MMQRAVAALAASLLLAVSLTPTDSAAHALPAATSALTVPPPVSVSAVTNNLVTTYAGGSTVVEDSLYSPTLDIHTSYRVMLPPGYDASTERYPTLYMLHGVAGDSSEWQSIGILEAADAMIQRGEIEPMIIVLPNGGAHYWVNQASGARWADYVVDDVVRQIDSEYRTVASPTARAIGGLSMGGEGALRIALTNPQVFSIAAAHSPSLRTEFDQFAPELYPIFGDEQTWRTMTPLWLVVDTDTAYELKIAVDVGEDDPWRPNVELFHQRMVDRGIAHRFEILPGEHAAEYWIENVGYYVQFYAESLSANAHLNVAADAF